jgi:hybrid cluster-associated redox disulfide protein
MSISEIVSKYPQTEKIFIKYGLHCVGCAASAYEDIEEAAKFHRIDIKSLTEDLNKAVEASDKKNTIEIVAEIPGIKKSDVKINLSGNFLDVFVDSEKCKYFRRFELPGRVDFKSIKTSYSKGLLKITFNRLR